MRHRHHGRASGRHLLLQKRCERDAARPPLPPRQLLRLYNKALLARRPALFPAGAPLGVAFSRVTVHPLGPLFPGLSLTEHSRCLVNFGQRRMRFLPEGFQPLTPPPAPERVRACQWLLAALERAAGPGPGGEENAAAVARAVGPHLAPLLCDECAAPRPEAAHLHA